MDDNASDEIAVQLPIDGELDLHTFRPGEMKELIPVYLDECRRRGIFSVRIVHGKGIGNLRRTVHAILEKLPAVAAFRLAGSEEGGWGATLVELRQLDGEESHGS